MYSQFQDFWAKFDFVDRQTMCLNSILRTGAKIENIRGLPWLSEPILERAVGTYIT